MTNEEILSIIQQYEPLINSLARGCWKKIRRPSPYDLEDLVQEANIVCIRSLPSFDETKSKLSTYIVYCIINHFTVLIRASWRKKRDPNPQISPEIKTYESPAGVARVHEFWEMLNDTEAQYLSAFLLTNHTQAAKDLNISIQGRNRLKKQIREKGELALAFSEE